MRLDLDLLAADFNRMEDGGLEAIVHFPLDLTMYFYSDDPHSPRAWVLDEVSIGGVVCTSGRQANEVEQDTQLAKWLDIELHKYIAMEQGRPYAESA